MTTFLLVLGYVMAVPFTLWVPGFRRLWKRREVWVLAVEEVGASLITVGWALRGGTGAAVVNGIWTVGLLGAWLLKGRRRGTGHPYPEQDSPAVQRSVEEPDPLT